MNENTKNLTIEELHKRIGLNVAKLRKKANFSQLALSLEMGNKSPRY